MSKTNEAKVVNQSQGRAGIVLIIVVMLLLGASILSSFLLFQRQVGRSISSYVPSSSIIAGSAAFVNSAQGINDKFEVAFPKLSSPKTGKAYYAWLLTDKGLSDRQSLLLGTLTNAQNEGSGMALMYVGDAQHSNLLTTYSRVVITQDDASFAPIAPISSWLYYGEITQVRPSITVDKAPYSMLDHVRHLDADDPTLEALSHPISNGLAYWLKQNIGKVQEWASAARNEQDAGLVHRHMLRILDYLAGSRLIRSILPQEPLMLDTPEEQVGVVRGDIQEQSYLSHVEKHLSGILISPHVPRDQRLLADTLRINLQQIAQEEEQVYVDALQLAEMTLAQLHTDTAHTLLDKMHQNADRAYVGYVDPITQERFIGVSDLYAGIEQLSTIHLFPCSPETCQKEQA